MMHGKPYFMENEEWYYFDKKECCYKLRPDAPEMRQSLLLILVITQRKAGNFAEGRIFAG